MFDVRILQLKAINVNNRIIQVESWNSQRPTKKFEKPPPLQYLFSWKNPNVPLIVTVSRMGELKLQWAL